MAARHTPFNNILDLYERHGIDWLANEVMVWKVALENCQQLEQNKHLKRIAEEEYGHWNYNGKS